LLNPVNFEIGVPSNAVVYITGPNATNIPPAVNIVSPTNDSVFYTPTDILLIARAGDPDGPITNVEFFDGTNDLGQGSPVILDPPGVNGATGLVYVFNWLNVPVGSQYVTAVATVNGGASTVSPTVNITVLPGPPPPPPSVRIISPPNGAVFFAPVNIPLFAFVNNSEPALVVVQFFDGTNLIGAGQPIPSPVAADGSSSPTPIGYPTNMFFLVWSNAPVGPHVLTAIAGIAYYNHGLAIRLTSPPVDITVLPSPPPMTNRPPIVNIVATDPVAIEGTNSWVWAGETNTPATWAAWPSAVCRFFTNSGPKTATFTVRRFGDTNDDTTVAYDGGGTASNGVDYVALPGFVTVPAGERSASITIVPIDDGPPDVNKTVILTLTPSTNTPPDYLVGLPARAAAVIIDPPGRCPVAGTLPDGCFRLSMPGPDGAWFCIEHSTNLTDWTPICTNQVVNGSIDFVDPCAPASASGFYRMVPVTNPPSE
ncbi:MAG TPA: Ig-like domain-containing protein, partial [Candidatus Acidoferrum sp.]|nr:Ig-like domain-containing protein [Candidatus Acidoferrum sp.]